MLIDKDTMLRRLGDNRKLLQSLAEMFPDEAANVLAAIKDARATKNAGEVHLNAHTLKGMCKMFDATSAADAASDLETTAAGGNLGSELQVSTLTSELDRAVQAVRSLHESLATS
jgi:HPt (histidine-containing phosphotransfer) domain-containing protein